MANPKILTLDIQYTVYSYNSAYTYSNMTILKYEKVYSKHIQLCMQYTVSLSVKGQTCIKIVSNFGGTVFIIIYFSCSFNRIQQVYNYTYDDTTVYRNERCTYKFYTVYLHAVYVYYTCCPSLMILFKPTFHTVKK